MIRVISVIVLILACNMANAEKVFQWPDKYKAAVSLSYDDSLSSQLDNSVPLLNKHQLKASFYLTLSSPTVSNRLAEWKAVAQSGHELGNHTLFHPCSGSLPGREWVAPQHNMDTKSIAEMVEEVKLANSFLQALDGKTQRTFTAPCFDLETNEGNYLPAIRDLFVAIKADNPKLPKRFDLLWMPANVSGKELISYVEQALKVGGVANILFHGIGNDYLAVSSQAHKELIEYLVANKERIWTDTYLNIMTYVQSQH